MTAVRGTELQDEDDDIVCMCEDEGNGCAPNRERENRAMFILANFCRIINVLQCPNSRLCVTRVTVRVAKNHEESSRAETCRNMYKRKYISIVEMSQNFPRGTWRSSLSSECAPRYLTCQIAAELPH